MSTPTLTFRLVLAGASGLLLLGGVAAAVTVDDGGDSPRRIDTAAAAPGDESATSTAPGPLTEGSSDPAAGASDPVPVPVPAPTSDAAMPTTARAPRATTTTRSRSAATSSAPGPLMAPKAGSYGYDATTRADGAAATTSKATVTVEAAGTAGADTLQDVTIPTGGLGQGTTIRSRVAWGPAGAIVSRSQASGGDCMWQPTWPQYVGDLKIGRAWSYDTSCSVTSPIQATIQRRGNRRVTGIQSIDVAGRRLATWTIEVDETTVITTALGVISVRSVGTEQLAPSLGLPVTKTEALSGTGIPPGSAATLKLVSLP